MSAPQLTVSVQGQGSVSADQLNTYEQTCDTFADLRSFIGTSGVEVYTRGGNSIADGLQGEFYWNSGIANPVDDNTNTIVPGGSSQGAWSRNSTLYAPIACTASGAANAIVLTPSAGQPNVSSYQNGQQFFFIAPNTSTGDVTIAVATNQGINLAPLNFYTTVGTQAGSGSVVANGGYLVTYYSTLNGGAGGFVMALAGIAAQLTAGTGIALSGSTNVTIATNLVAGTGIALTGTNPLSIAAVAKVNSQSSPSSPTGPASTSSNTMMGLAGSITPAVTGAILVIVSGVLTSSTGSAGNGIAFGIAYGTGTAPVNGAALTGTSPGASQKFTSPAASTAADIMVPFSIQSIVTGLTKATAYWLDLYAEAVGATGFSFANLLITAVEI